MICRVEDACFGVVGSVSPDPHLLKLNPKPYRRGLPSKPKFGAGAALLLHSPWRPRPRVLGGSMRCRLLGVWGFRGFGMDGLTRNR